jgi:hypothetical protein
MLCPKPSFQSRLAAGALALALGLVPCASRGYELSIAASNGGGALTPWVGSLDGSVDVVAYTEQGDGARVWARHAETIATPPIPGETWFPRQLRGRQAMYQLIQFIVDWLCSSYQPANPTLLGSLTGYDFEQEATATNPDFGISVHVLGSLDVDVLPALTGTATAVAELPFPYCLNTYVVTGTVSPDGPGFARMDGEASLPLFDGTTLVLAVHGRYAFDPTLSLPAPYAFELSGAFTMAGEDPQRWSLDSTYLERAELVGVQPPDAGLVASRLAAFPNPFRSGTTFRFDLPEAASIRLQIIDVSGRLVRRLVDGSASAGRHVVSWDGRTEAGIQAPAGVYWGRLDVPGQQRDEKLIRME